MIESLVGAVVTAAVSTLGDYLWKNVLPHRQPIYWFAHAVVLFATVGFCLGLPARKPAMGVVGAAAIVGTAAYVIGLAASFWLPEPSREELPE